MAIQVKAPGNAPNTGAPGFTPAPTKIVRPAAPDNISAPKVGSSSGYGMSNFTGAASITPGQRVVSPLGANLEASVDDPALAQVRANGTRADHISEGLAQETRKVSDAQMQTTFGHRSRRGEIGPGNVGNSTAPTPVRKP
jgi:hypothetical protein